ncbi:2,4'-dihydroxyacetophenone dioxygenase family protein [Undibacterium sp. RuTC16W]|uniref:2,4'-dihydroxyacetophenone dioxygenase family protein n=1 Tax=Undibacterium sp. RuTC16W TaxID=3413048 RepID=UPI003BF1CBCD
MNTNTLHSPGGHSASTSATLFSTHCADLPWVRWAMPGAQFKLLSADPDSGRFSLMIKVEKDSLAPLHRHVGAVEGYILEGSFHYHDDPVTRFVAGDYLLEKDGAIHRPVSPEGTVMFAVFHGPVEGIAETGEVIGTIDCQWHMRAWQSALDKIASQSGQKTLTSSQVESFQV